MAGRYQFDTHPTEKRLTQYQSAHPKNEPTKSKKLYRGMGEIIGFN